MPKYRIELADGRKFEIEADRPPSEQDVLAAIGGQKPAQEAPPAKPQAKAPSMIDTMLADNQSLTPALRAGLGLTRFIKNDPVTAGAIAGGMAAVPLTGGASIPGVITAAGLGSAGGAGVGHTGRQIATGKAENPGDVLKSMATQGVLGAAGEGAGQLLTGTLRMAGRGLYRAGLLPINQMLGKYGDVVKTGVENAVPVSKGGLEKIGRIKGERIAEKGGKLAAADERVAFSTKNLTDEVLSNLSSAAQKSQKAGLGSPLPRQEAIAEQILKQNGPGVSPSQLEDIKRTWDDQLGGAFQKIRKREPLTPKEKFGTELVSTASRNQEAAVPGYREMNRGIMDAGGLEKAIARRTTGSAGNQGLENALTMLGGPGAIPARLLMLPPVMSGAGIAAYKTGQAMKQPAGMLLRALLSALGAEQEQEQ